VFERSRRHIAQRIFANSVSSREAARSLHELLFAEAVLYLPQFLRVKPVAQLEASSIRESPPSTALDCHKLRVILLHTRDYHLFVLFVLGRFAAACGTVFSFTASLGFQKL